MRTHDGSGIVAAYVVEATDGSIGTVDDSTGDIPDVTASYLVVDVGYWIFGGKRLVPARAVCGVDQDSRTIRVSLTKEQVRNAPDYDGDTWDEDSRAAHETYYAPYGR